MLNNRISSLNCSTIGSYLALTRLTLVTTPELKQCQTISHKAGFGPWQGEVDG